MKLGRLLIWQRQRLMNTRAIAIKPKILEDGTYDELMEKNGCFAELVARQQVNAVR